MDATPIVQWVAPVASTLIITAGTALINQRVKDSDRKADQRHEEAEAERKRRDAWREGISARLGKLEERVDMSHKAQCSQIRSDIVHRCHRYLDDLSCASTEEKNSLYESYRDYQRFCEQLNIENHFIDILVQRVMELPERDL